MTDHPHYAPATVRKRDFILDVLLDVLPTTGIILEVASGSGEHIVHFARNLPTTALPKTERSTHRTADGTGRRSRAARIGQPALSGRPLLVIDGDSFAHRSYHALPKTIRRSDGKGAGVILGFANFLIRIYDDEQPRAVVVGWDSLEAPTKRHEMFAAYQSGREFDDDLIEQLNVLPELVAAFGFSNAKAPGYEADDFLAAAVAAEERAGGAALVASGDRDSFQLASPSTTILYPSRDGEIARIGPEGVRQRYGVDPNQVPDFIALRGDPSDKLPGAAGVGPNVLRNWCGDTAHLMESSRPVSFKLRPRCSASIG
jgi:5'-3' exonuclease, N-terminal resolvase-like domain/Protein of unknown function (DUF938)